MSKTDKNIAPRLFKSPAGKQPIAARPYATGVTIGALILTLFGGFWASAGLMNLSKVPAWIYIILSLPVIVLILSAASRLINIKKLPEVADDGMSAREGKKIGIAFGIVFAVEFILIAAAAVILNKLNRPLLIPIAVALIVGLHFLPLARLFQVPVYSVTGLLCIACALASLFVSNEALRLLLLGLSIAIVLWVSAGIVLLLYAGFRRSRPLRAKLENGT